MSELRFNPIAGEWVVMAPGRGRRPVEHAPPPQGDLPEHDDECPFCPGNEEMTPPPVLVLPEDTDGPGGWRVRVVPNKYAIAGDETAQVRSEATLLPARSVGGAYEVVIETPVHNLLPRDMSLEAFTEVVGAMQRRYAAIYELPAVKHVLLFKNHGRSAGTSLMHPHSQIAGLPVVSETVRRRRRLMEDHYSETGRCLLCDLTAEELAQGRRIVHSDAAFTVFCPYASAFVAEVWVVPGGHSAFPESDARALARALGAALAALGEKFDNPDFNYVLHTPPKDGAAAGTHWYVQITPRMAALAGLEIGAGVHVNTMAPEEAAQALRSAWK